jgi:hypothetical protein
MLILMNIGRRVSTLRLGDPSSSYLGFRMTNNETSFSILNIFEMLETWDDVNRSILGVICNYTPPIHLGSITCYVLYLFRCSTTAFST